MLVQIDLDTLNNLTEMTGQITALSGTVAYQEKHLNNLVETLDRLSIQLDEVKHKLAMAEPLPTLDVVNMFRWFVARVSVRQYEELYKPMSDHLDANQKIYAARLVRSVLGISLRSAKAIVDKENELNG